MQFPIHTTTHHSGHQLQNCSPEAASSDAYFKIQFYLIENNFLNRKCFTSVYNVFNVFPSRNITWSEKRVGIRNCYIKKKALMMTLCKPCQIFLTIFALLGARLALLITLSRRPSVGRSVGTSVKFLKWQELSLPCSYRCP